MLWPRFIWDFGHLGEQLMYTTRHHGNKQHKATDTYFLMLISKRIVHISILSIYERGAYSIFRSIPDVKFEMGFKICI